MANKGILPLFLIFIILQACKYEPEDVYNLPVNENPTPPELQVVNLNDYQDSIFIYSGEIKFNYTLSSQEIQYVSFIIDGIEYTNIEINKNSFDFYYGNPEYGIHNLTVKIYTGTGSGSLADQLGAETFVFSKTWKLVVDLNYSSRIQGNAQNGFLKISWAPYRLNDFKEFVIYKSYRYAEWVELKRINEPYFIDSSYVGEECEYSVDLITKNGKNLYWGRLQLSRNLPQINLTTTSNNEYIINWNRSKYYNAINSYKLVHGSGSDNNLDFFTENPNDTSFVFTNGLFGDKFYFRLQVLPKKSYIPLTPDILYNYETQKEIRLGHPYANSGFNIMDLHQVDAENFVYINGCDSLIKYSTYSLSTVEKLGYSTPGCSGCNFSRLTFSTSGKYITNYKVCTNDLMLINSENMSNYSVHNLQSMTGAFYAPQVLLSENGVAIVEEGNTSNGGFYLYNLNTNTIIKHYYREFYGGSGENISSKGDYIFLTDDSLRLVKYENETFVNIWSTELYSNLKYYQFNPIIQDQLVTWNGTTFSIRNCNDFSIIHEYQLTDGSILNIDFFKNEMLTQIKGHLLVRNMLNGNLLHDIPINFDASAWNSACILVNHTIVSLERVMYFLN